MANLVLKDVSKLYPSGALALCKVNLEVSDREFIALIGSEKSGKTTLLRVIAGLEEATDGQVVIGDKDMTGVPPKDRDVAMIFRNDTLYPSLNVYENIAYGLKMRHFPQAAVDARVKAAAEILGLTEVLNRKPKTLTAAQRQRVALGRAIAREPKLYLLDDPIAGLDDALRAQMRSLIINLQARVDGTFIYATKNVNEALTMATRVVVMREGVVQQVDTPANLYDYPANAYVALLVGSPAINLLPGAALEEEQGTIYAVCNGLRFALAEQTAARLIDAGSYVGTGKKVIVAAAPSAPSPPQRRRTASCTPSAARAELRCSPSLPKAPKRATPHAYPPTARTSISSTGRPASRCSAGTAATPPRALPMPWQRPWRTTKRRLSRPRSSLSPRPKRRDEGSISISLHKRTLPRGERYILWRHGGSAPYVTSARRACIDRYGNFSR